MRKHSVLALSLLAFACSGDDDQGGAGGRAGSGAVTGSGGSTTGGAGGSGGSTGGTGGAGGNTGGSGGTTGGSGGSGGTTGGAGGNTGGSGGTTGGAGGTGGSTGGTAGSAGSTGGTAGSAGSSAKDAGAGAGGTSSDAGKGDGGQGGSGMPDVQSDQTVACPVGNFPSVTDFSKVGPYMAAPAEAIGTTCTVFRPTVLGEGGVKHPVVIWGNGTGGNPGVYTWLLAHWATHGFVVVAAQTGSAGTGAEMVGCLDWIEAQNSAAGSIYNGKIALSRAAASGHSQGGGGTLMAGRDARFLTTVPFQAYTQQGFGGFDQASISLQKGPMLLMSGSADTIAVPAQNQQPVFMNTNVPVYWGTLTGADHVTFALGLTLGGGNPAVVGYLGPSTAWLRLHLMCDESARGIFYGTPACTLCQDTKWASQRKGIN